MALASTNIENDPEDARIGSPASGGTTPKGPLSAMANAGGGGPTPLSGVLTEQIGQLKKTRSEKKAVIDEAIKNLSSRETSSGPSAEELFRLMGAFAAPTKTGGFSETLGKVGEVGADILGKRKASATSLADLKTKYKLQGLDVDSEHLKEVIDAQKSLQAENAPSSVYGKTARDEGLQPGTPAYNARVSELATADLDNKAAKAKGPEAGSFDTKTGNYVAPNGTVIKAAEIKEDRTGRDAILKLQDQLKMLDPKTVKNADSFFDYTGAGTGGEFAKTIGSKIFPETAKAQSKITAAALNDRLKNLPPGPASDKDIAQAKSTFPGFANAKVLQDWVDRTNEAVNNYLKRQDAKYGDIPWYGAGATPGAPGAPGAPPAPAAPPANAKPVPGSPKVGAVLKGHRFLGGDPQDKASWEKVK